MSDEVEKLESDAGLRRVWPHWLEFFQYCLKSESFKNLESP